MLAPENARALVINRADFRALVVSREEGVDVNAEIDFEFAELLATRRGTAGATAARASDAA